MAAVLLMYRVIAVRHVALHPNSFTLGAKGIGESGTIGSMPAVQNAVIDALSHMGVRHIDMPCTPQRVWNAMQAAAAGTSSDPWREPPAVFERLPIRGRVTKPADDVEI